MTTHGRGSGVDMTERVDVPATEAEVLLSCDVVVCGGGSAGLGAALAAARAGASTALVERWPFFGGNATAASLGSICGLYDAAGRDEFDFLAGGIAREWAEELVAAGSAMGPIPYKDTAVLTYAPWGYKRLADRKIREVDGLTPILHAPISGVVRSGGDIDAVVVATKRGPMAVRGRIVVDATGDADVAFHAGSETEMGEPGRLQYPSMQFHVQGVDLGKAMEAGLGQLSEKMREALEGDDFELTRSGGATIPTGRPGEAIGAMTRIARADGDPPDGTHPVDLTEAELHGRDVAEESHRFLREQMPGFEDSFLQDTAVTVGIRETRHVVGAYLLSGEEAASATKHPDGIASSAWPFEYHTEGADTRWESLPPGDWFEIPYRSLVAEGVDNLLVAGRCISADHEALASSRVTGVCMAIGEAAGLAAARCAADGVRPRELDGEKLRAELVERGVVRDR